MPRRRAEFLLLAVLAWTLATRATAAKQLTFDGEACQFPATYEGREINECVDMGNGLFCPVASGQFKLCAFRSPPSNGHHPSASPAPPQAASPPPAAPLVADNALPCASPLLLYDQAVTTCLVVHSRLSCWTPDTGNWSDCSPMTWQQPADLGNIPVLPSQRRVLLDGTPCPLPWVDATDRILVDCVFNGNVEYCPSLNGTRECRAADAASSGAQDALLLSQRTTEEGNLCELPFVFNESVFLDCYDANEDDDAIYGVCPVQTDDPLELQFEACAAPANASVRVFDAELAFEDRAQPGTAGLFCQIAAAQGTAQGCADDLSCVPLQTTTGYAQFKGLGFCIQTPIGGVFDVFATLEQAGVSGLGGGGGWVNG